MKIEILKMVPSDEIQSVMICGKWHLIVEGTFEITPSEIIQFTSVRSGWMVTEPEFITAVSSAVIDEVRG